MDTRQREGQEEGDDGGTEKHKLTEMCERREGIDAKDI